MDASRGRITKLLDRPATLVVGIVVLAWIVRTIWVMLAPAIDPVLRNNLLHGDASGYHRLATNMVQGLGFTWDGQTPTSYRVPGYPAFVALLYLLFGPDLQVVRLVQALLGALICLPVFAIARRLGEERVAVLAGLGVALHPIMIYMSGWLYSETLFLLLLWTGLWLLISALDDESRRQAIGSGLVLGLATLVRPEAVAVPGLVLLGSWLLYRSRRYLALLVLVQIGAMLVLLPWTARNVAIHDAPVILTTSGGSNLFAGNNPESDGGSAWSYPLSGLSEVESDQELGRRARTWIKDNPSDFVALLPKKLHKFFSPATLETSGSPLGVWTLPIEVIYGVFLLMAAWGAVVGWRSDRMVTLVLLTATSWYVAVALIFYGGTRVALPIAPALLILAALAGVQLLTRIRWSQRLNLEWAR